MPNAWLNYSPPVRIQQRKAIQGVRSTWDLVFESGNNLIGLFFGKDSGRDRDHHLHEAVISIGDAATACRDIVTGGMSTAATAWRERGGGMRDCRRRRLAALPVVA
jgi:hypothetical protein